MARSLHRGAARLALVFAFPVLACSVSPSASNAPASTPAASSAVAGFGVVELVAPATEGGGEAPKFEWQAVEGAASYRLFILDADRKPLWAWDGTGTSVWLGGLPEQLPEGEAGPRITAGSSWTVAALDADHHVIALSAARDVSP